MPIAAKDLSNETFLRLLLLGRPKLGKAQPIDEPVLTPDGWRPIGDLTVGDAVIGSDGGATEVVGVFPQGQQSIVRVTADDDGWTMCSEDHLWLTTTRLELKRGRYRKLRNGDGSRTSVPTGRVGAGTVKTAAMLSETVEAIHYLPSLSRAARFSRLEQPLPLDSYYLGLLLGDGCFRNESITWTKTDPYLIDRMQRLAASIGDWGVVFDSGGTPGVRITRSDRSGGSSPSATLAIIRQLGLDGCLSQNKFIPPQYLLATPEERLALLRGLCDTDGHATLKDIGTASQCEYSTSSSSLRDDVVELARSLGGRAYARAKETDHLPAWSIMVSFNDGTCPFQTPVKAEKWTPFDDRERFWRKRVESVEPSGEAECVCIKVAVKDSLYVTRGHLLTHNSTAAIATSPGPRRVLLCEDISALRGAKRLTLDFDVEPITNWNSMTAAVVEAKQDAKAGKIKTVVIDPLSDFADRLLKECFKATITHDGKEDGRRAYPMLSDRLGHLIELVFTIPAHVIVICHYMETGGDPIDGGLEKTGEGIVPLLPGKSRALIAAKFSDVIWMDLATSTTGNGIQKGERIFVTGPRGAWGPGCRSLEGTQVLKADIGELLKAFAAQAKSDAQPHPTNHRPPPTKTLPSKPIIRKPATT